MAALIGAVKGAGRRIDLFQRWLRFQMQTSFLNPRRMPVLDPAIFAGKRVIILGPASTALSDVEGLEVDGFDVVVRLNNGIMLALENPTALGSRTDVLFHNLNDSGPRSAGAIPVPLLVEQKLKYLVFPHWSFRGSKAKLYEKRDELSSNRYFSLLVPSPAFCEDVRRSLGGLKPTTGASAILYFLACDLRELHIHGFTFFQTAYLPGYNDEVKDAVDAAKWVADSNAHDPALEKVVIARRIDEARRRGMKVILGAGVAQNL